jgi:predicted phosphodiesterase
MVDGIIVAGEAADLVEIRGDLVEHGLVLEAREGLERSFEFVGKTWVEDGVGVVGNCDGVGDTKGIFGRESVGVREAGCKKGHTLSVMLKQSDEDSCHLRFFQVGENIMGTRVVRRLILANWI